MRLFLLNILLAVLWMCMWGLFDIYSLLAGFGLGYLLLGIVSRTLPGEDYGAKGWKVPFVCDLLLENSDQGQPGSRP